MKIPVYIFDIDGTLADGSHRIHHIRPPDGTKKDWDTYFSLASGDAPIPHMVQLCQTLAENTRIKFVSGRRGESYWDTLHWLRKHVGPWIYGNDLYVRTVNDYRADDIIKIEILNHIKDNGFEPIMAFDDRNRVVKAWRDAGVPCAQVAEGDF